MLRSFDLFFSSADLGIKPKALTIGGEHCNPELQPDPCFVETRSFYVATASLELIVLLSAPQGLGL